MNKNEFTNKNGFTKGRQLEEGALAQVLPCLSAIPREKSQLIEALHAIQDEFGSLSHAHLQALSEEFRLSMAEVHEVASFYSHFVIGEPLNNPIRVCISLSCMLAGAQEKILALKAEGKTVLECSCLGLCSKAPVQHEGAFKHATIEVRKPNLPHFKAIQTGELTSEQVLNKLEQANLKGLGGAGFPTHRKWSIVKAQKGDKILVVNADEGEPGTFKDKMILQERLDEFLDGMLVAGEVIKAKAIYIYLRDEYPKAREMLKSALAQLNMPHIHLRRGAGAYVCGEESALLSSLEGKRGLPKLRPPYVAEKGLFGQPTLVNNVETLYCVSEILKGDFQGERHYSVSGHVKNAGIYKARAGITAHELLKLAGGMSDGHDFKAYLPGGASGGILPASLANEPLDFGTLQKHGAFIGSHAVIFLSHQDNMKAVVKNLSEFFAHESCGQCTPCREGAHKLAHLTQYNEQEIKDLADVMMDASICGLGQAAPNPILSLYRHFREELE